MTPFLKQVARHYHAAGNLENRCFIFPNRRAKSFFRKFLAEEVASSGRPVIAPRMLTMDDFFFTVQGAGRTDRVNQLLVLYDCYKALNPNAESLDDFIFWGDVLLSDFDDVDKYLVNPAHIFANVADFKSIQDTYSYLTENQLDAINRFLGHFRGGGELTVDLGSDADYKARFLRIWDILHRLYASFGEALSARGLSYDGMVYRGLADRLDSEPVSDILSSVFPDVGRYVFVGLNALNECEKKVMSRMRDAGLAQFCWDWSSREIKTPHNRSALFLADNVARFPQAFEPDPEGLDRPQVNVLSVPSSIGQAKQIPAILDGFRRDGAAVPGIETAIILPDENLLIPVLNSIPEDIRDINVTMGYPMSGSEFWSLMNDVAGLQMHLRRKDGQWLFYHKQVWAVFSNSVFKAVLTDAGRDAVQKIKSSVKYYIPLQDFSGDPALELIFRPAVTDPASADAGQVKAIADYLLSLVAGMASLLSGVDDMALEMDFARDYHQAVTRLSRYQLPVLPSTWFRLLGSLVGGMTVPFQGEPLKGLQIMGPLETRALDFSNLVILSCNEGVFPRRNVSSSFIPPELRKGFGLPSYEYQDAVWAYYFYRMIQRADTVWMLMDSRTEGVRSGEESRYIKQLELDFGFKVNRYVAKSVIGGNTVEDTIEKTAEHIGMLRKGHLSASSLQNYLACPAKFYYQSVCRLKEEDEVAESLDSGMLGDVFHKTMETLYGPHATVTRSIVKGYLRDAAGIRSRVADLIKEKLNTFEITGRNIIFLDVVCRYVVKALERDIELMDRYGVDGFTLHGTELKVEGVIDGFPFIGFVDRLDSFDPSEVRIVDYKTGAVTDNDFLIDGDNAEKVVEALFGSVNKDRPKIALQLYLYDRFVSGLDVARGRKLVNSIYQTSRLFVNEVQNVSLNEKFCKLMEERLSALLAELADTDVPWSRTQDVKTCGYCDFKTICGR